MLIRDRGRGLHGKCILFAEGCRGSLSQQLMSKFNLRDGVDPQVYGLGVKELWQVPQENHQPGLVVHSQGWPLPHDVGGGSFLPFENPKGANSWGILGGLNLAVEHGLRVEVEGRTYAGEYLEPTRKYRFKVEQQ